MLARALSMNNPGFTAYTPIFSAAGGGAAIGNGTVFGEWRRVGDSIEVFIRVTFGNTSTFGAGNFRVTLPTGLVRDPTKVLSTSDFTPGHAFALDASAHANDVQCYVNVAASSNFMEFLPTRSTGAALSAAVPFAWTTNDVINIGVEVPIDGY
jgi:hypothetical protein